MDPEAYKQFLHEESLRIHAVAKKARLHGYDPALDVEIQLARNMAERVVGLVSVMAPQIVGAGIAERIVELEKQYGVLDWRVSLQIALEVAESKFCTFKDQVEAIEVGVRIGFAYATVGVVSSPLEGFVNLELKDRMDGQGKFFCLNFSGPIRNAGGTAAAQCVVIADYVRVKLGFAVYDPTEDEVNRCHVELDDYHERVTILQYKPSKEENDFLMRKIPVEISGDPSEKMDVSNYKNIPRIPTNKIRSGYCLLHSSCIPLKAPKIWKQLDKWGKDFQMEHWGFLAEFVKLQKKIQAGKAAAKPGSGDGPKVTPNYTYVADLVAGRPVFGHPLRTGAFRLRYGRARTSGLSAQCVHPSTMVALRTFIATASQLKVERPGKAAAFTVCDSIEGPIVKLNNGSVVKLESEEQARALKKEISEIIYAGDLLVCYGDFANRAHLLCPVGYCEEWWVQEVEVAITASGEPIEEWSERAGTDLAALIANPFQTIPFSLAAFVTERLKVPLHPRFTYVWKAITREALATIVQWCTTASLVLEGNRVDKIIGPKATVKRALEDIGLPHSARPDHVVIEGEWASAFLFQLGVTDSQSAHALLARIESSVEEPLAILASATPLRDKGGTFIGTRMGRPEKAKMRALSSSPHGLFPIGEQGGRLRSIQSALEKGYAHVDVAYFVCSSCGREGMHHRCLCGAFATPFHWHTTTGIVREVPTIVPREMAPYKKQKIPLREHLDLSLKMLHTQVYPDLIKGIRGLGGKEKHPEHLIKAILRARHDLTVNKDGTVRYDASEVPLTHFTPREVGTSVTRLLGIGYDADIHGEPLTRDDQVLLLKPQDVVLPSCPDSPDERCDAVLLRVTRFIDELLIAYGEKPFYNCKGREDLAGHLVVGLAPHTSAGTVARIVGFSATQGLYCHPYMHCAMRRDCFTAETIIPLHTADGWSLQSLGEVVEELNPTKRVDSFGTLETRPAGYQTLTPGKKGLVATTVTAFTKHAASPTKRVRTKLGRVLTTTLDHKHIIIRNGTENVLRTSELQVGDVLKSPYVVSVPEQDVLSIDLVKELSDRAWLMVRGLSCLVPTLRDDLRSLGVTLTAANNFASRDSVPVRYATEVMRQHKITSSNVRIGAVRDNVSLPGEINLTPNLLSLIGLYIAEGYAREQKELKGYYQIYIAAQKEEIREFVRQTMAHTFGLVPSERKLDRVTYSSRILYELFTSLLACGSEAYSKRIPKRLLALPKNKLGSLLSGYLEGDGSVSKTDLRIVFDTVSSGLQRDLEFAFGRLGAFVKYKESTRLPGKRVRDFYERKGRAVPKFTCTRGTIQSKFVHALAAYVGFLSAEKKSRFATIVNTKRYRNLFSLHDDLYFYDPILQIEDAGTQVTYCLSVPEHTVVANGLITKQCDGDESCVFLLLDGFLNFSKAYLPTSRGGTMDAPLVLTTILNPAEVDDMVFDMDVATRYPLALYEAALQYKMPWDVKVPQIKALIGTPGEDTAIGYTHPVTDINAGVLCSSYKTLPSMQDKLMEQMKLAEQLRCVDEQDVARLVIEKHFIRDVKGNLRKFSTQQFRCMHCNEKYRRPPITKGGLCPACNGKVGFTISEGSVIKYLVPMESLARNYNVPAYLQQTIALTRRRVEEVFGKDGETQTGLGSWFG